MPLALLWVPKPYLDAVATRITLGTGDMTRVWMLVATELALAVASDLLGRGRRALRQPAGRSFTNRVSVRLMEHAISAGPGPFEEPVFYDKLERARRQTTGRLGMLAGC